jgi:hypothetical protein
MLSINQLVSQWRGWINRTKSFDGNELDELENHLLEEIDYLTEKGGLTEDVAFTKAVIEMGKRENLDKEFTKVRGYVRPMSWIQKNSLTIIVSLLLIIIYFLVDNNYSSKHKAYFYKNPRNIYVDLKNEPTDLFVLGSKENPIKMKIKYWAKVQLDETKSDSYYYVIVDDQDQIWFDTDNNISNIQGEYFYINSLYETGVNYKPGYEWRNDNDPNESSEVSYYTITRHNIGFLNKNDSSIYSNTFGPFKSNQIISLEVSAKKRLEKRDRYLNYPIFYHFYIDRINWSTDKFNIDHPHFLMNQLENVEKPIHLWDLLFQHLQKL